MNDHLGPNGDEALRRYLGQLANVQSPRPAEEVLAAMHSQNDRVGDNGGGANMTRRWTGRLAWLPALIIAGVAAGAVIGFGLNRPAAGPSGGPAGTTSAPCGVATTDSSGVPYIVPTLAATPMPGPTVCLANPGINQLFAGEGVFVYAPAAGTEPAISQADAEAVLNQATNAATGATYTMVPGVTVRSATLVVFDYAKIGRAPVLAWVFDVSPAPGAAASCDYQPLDSLPPGFCQAQQANTHVNVQVVDAQAGDARVGQVIFGR